jgi:predicted DNA-binding transcriptional regulator
MAEVVKARIGFVSGGAGSMPHYNSFLPIVPKGIEIDFQGLGLYGKSLYEIAEKRDFIVRRVRELVAERGWAGVILSAAPTEVLNPGLYDSLQSALSVPFTTALNACVAALRAYSAPRVLLLTPFDARLNDLIVEHLKKVGVTALAPQSFAELAVPKRMTPEEVLELAKKNLAAVGKVDAIYFQGAVLDPIKCLERIESELNSTVIASNPAMLWYVLSGLGLKYPMNGYGRLLKEWPAVAE